MPKWLKIILLSLAGIFLLIFIAGGVFIYKVSYGFPIYESTPPELPAEMKDYAILVFSKTNGFRHGEAIKASLKAFDRMGEEQNWTFFATDNGAVFNEEQLAQFDVVIWNNVTGGVLREAQRQAFRQYIENGGGFVGIHGAGDASHPWPWYQEQLIGASFTHHTMNPQFQQATMHRDCSNDHPICTGLPEEWTREEEWYVFYDNPRDKGAKIIYTVDESTFDPNGNFSFLVKNKDFGMGDDHPIVWYRCVGNGKAFYSALGHRGAAFEEPLHLKMLAAAIRWAGTSGCH